MPSIAWQSRLVALLGAPVLTAAETQLLSLVDGRVREDSDLDFKQALYGNSDPDRRELAADVAAMANDRGGVIVIGLREEAEVAAELSPVMLGGGEEGRMRQIIASNTAPPVPVEIKVVDSAAETEGAALGYYVLSIPPSPLRPHAVRVHQSLRYPRRHGSTRRWLSESEVADLYRDRFRLAEDQTARLIVVMQDGVAAMNTSAGAFIAVAVVPTVPGSLVIDSAAVRACEAFALDLGQAAFWRGFTGSPRAGVGARRLTLGTIYEGGHPPNHDYAELHADGAGFAATCLSDARPARAGHAPDFWILGEHLLLALARCLRLAGLHAERTGTWGDAVVEARIICEQESRLAYCQEQFAEHVDGRPLKDVPASRHTVLIEDLVRDQAGLAATRMLATDFFHAYGSHEVRHLASDGTIRIRYWSEQQGIRALAKAHGVAVTEDTVA